MTPRSFPVKILPSGVVFDAPEGVDLLRSARQAGYWLPFECGWGGCGTCRVTLLEGEVEVLFPEAPSLTLRDLRRRRILACQTAPRGPLVIEARVSDAPPEDLAVEHYQARVRENRPLAPGVHLLILELDRPASFFPGQYAFLSAEPGLRRAYSMVNLPGGLTLEFLVRRYPQGSVSPKLTSSGIGEVLSLELPYGRAYLRKTDRPVVMVAGGTGIAPILSMVQAWALWEAPFPLWVFYGARTPLDLVLRDRLEEAVRKGPGRLVLTVDQDAPGWTGEVGLLPEVVERWLPENWEEYEWYVAGPPPMVQAMRAFLERVGVSLDRVHYDSFG